MRCPVLKIIVSHLLDVGAVRAHTSDLHSTPAISIEINVSAIGRKIGVVAYPLAVGQCCLGTALRWDRENCQCAFYAAREKDRLSIRRPAMEPGVASAHLARRSTLGRNDEYAAIIAIGRRTGHCE